MSGPLVVVGDALLDVDVVGAVERVAPDAPVPVLDVREERPRPGGAALAALLAARDGREVVLVAPLADDAAASRLRSLLEPHLRLVPLAWGGSTPVKTRVRSAGQSLVRLDTGGADGPVGDPGAEVTEALAAASAVLVADYGRGATASPALRTLLARAAARVPLVWDPHPRGASPVPGARLCTPNGSEAARAAVEFGVPADLDGAVAAASRRGDALVRGWGASAVSVTLGARGALLSYGEGAPLVVPAPFVPCADPCGAGDRFAAAAAGLLADGALASEAVAGAVAAASAFVAAGGASAVRVDGAGPTVAPVVGGQDRAADVIAATRAAGGTVVATGGCFDLLHAGHVATLEAARALGDCLVVCLNSDASVRRLKGPERPLQPHGDRRRVLEALACVDAVVVFDEDTPEAALDRLRPDVWAKGGDYAGTELPESTLVRSWGGAAVVLPYLDGRSTTALVKTARDRGAALPSGNSQFADV
ncbi:D-glycero-beta-D-manno-heptose 1-phosphate adenylyltransferase [Motilibacter aurantiacus]|uniref:D-glycero-beta-D-manno-heptose 1-phosphate adenylyltransferase n=1 Tax=Motilibacter aurantiacus TaxID=2714955 RepID=UPI00140C5FA1|nr:D-glycero-beta-D-manno-heptose 1-phosphate adenylyltransferase [Motilibacter aurantiacus]